MIKTIITRTAVLLFVCSIMSNCSSPKEKVEHKKEKVIESKQELKKANEAYLAEIEKYKEKSTQNTADQEKIIAELMKKASEQKKDMAANYNENLVQLEKKNLELKKKMESYIANGKNEWESFKTEFDHDMLELEKALKKITKNNVE